MAVGQGQPESAGAGGETAAATSAGPSLGPPVADPFSAYEESRFGEAAQGFEQLKQRRPDDPVVDLNLGTARYRLGEFQAADRAYQAAAARAEDPVLRSEALYNLGNTAYREGRLVDAIDRYTEALDLNPDDQDAKFNLEFVRRELEQEQQQQQDQSGDGEQDPQEGDSGGEGNSGGGEQDGEQEQQEGDEQQSGSRGQNQDQDGADEDQDGLSDEQERAAENPTDPSNPDSDGDGRLDGEEDANRNGRVDPGETDPNEPDPLDPSEADAQAQDQQPAGGRQMTPEEAQRFLQALQEERPPADRKAQAAKLRQEKDW